MRANTMNNFAVLFVAAFGTAASCASAANVDMKVIKRYQLGGEGGWDGLTLDANARRLYVTRGDHVLAIDADNGRQLGDILGAKHSHGVALVPELKRGYISNGHGDSVSVFDLDTLKITSEIAVGKDPDAILYDTASKRVFAFNGHSNDASVIDPVAGKVIATMAAPGTPEFAVSDGTGHVFFNVEDKAQIAQVDAKAAKVLSAWSLGTCEGPTGLAIDTAHKRLFSVCINKQMVVLDATDGHIVAKLPIGDRPDASAYDAETAMVYSANGDGTLTVIHQDDADHYHVVANIATPQRSRTLALDPKTHHVYLAAAEFGKPPAPSAEEPHPKPAMKPGSFAIVVVGKP